MLNDLLHSFSILDGFYASIQEACDIHKITRNSVIPENLERLFNYLSHETCEEIKVAIDLAFKIKSRQLLPSEIERVRKGFKTVTNLFNDYGWLFTKTNAINEIKKIEFVSIL